MAKRMLTCIYCKEKFDANSIPFVQVASRRYAHKSCSDRIGEQTKQEEKARQDLMDYIQKIFHDDVNWPLVGKQLKTYKEENNYSYSGMLKCLIYTYEIKKTDISKAKGVGVIPIYYKDAYNYYYSIWEANQRNEGKKIEDYVPIEEIIEIPIPTMNLRRKKLFSFLDEVEDGE